MKAIKANNYDIASKELIEFSEDLKGKIPTEVKFEDRKHYVSAMVKVIDKPGQPKNEVKIDVICQDKLRFERMSKNFLFHGYSKMVVLHDPSNLEEEDDFKAPLHVERKTEEEIRKELQGEMDEKFKTRLDAEMKKFKESQKQESKGQEGADQNPIDEGKKVIQEMKGADLETYATANEIDLTGLKTVEEKRTAILTWYEENANPAK